MRFKDLTNQRFGKLLVLHRDGTKKQCGKSRVVWVCQCDCGNSKNIIGNNLSKKTGPKSCGCDRKRCDRIDLIGQNFGELVVVALSNEKTKTRGLLWECKCSCGKIVKLATNCLTSGNNKTCGDKKIHPKQSEYCGEIPMPHITNTKQNAIKRNLEFTVSPEYLWQLFLQQNRKCSLSGVNLYFTTHSNASVGRSKETNASLDRIDSSKGYTEDNVQWVHKDLNRMKWSKTDDEFITWCNRVKSWQDRGKILDRNRPDWDQYFIYMAFSVAMRSHDFDRRHGCIITTEDHKLLSTGYNGFPKGMPDELLPNTRPDKNSWMTHAEENALLNCPVPLHMYDNLKAYVTGRCCFRCIKSLWNAGIKEIIMANTKGSVSENNERIDFNDLVNISGVKLKYLDINKQWVKNCYNEVKEAIQQGIDNMEVNTPDESPSS